MAKQIEEISKKMDEINKIVKWVNWIVELHNGYDSKGNSVLNKELESLRDVAKKNNIPIIVDDMNFINHPNAAGLISYRSNLVSNKKSNFKIFIRNECKRSIAVLAHELGHFFAVERENDRSERRAEEIAIELIERYCISLDDFEEYRIYGRKRLLSQLELYCEVAKKRTF